MRIQNYKLLFLIHSLVILQGCTVRDAFPTLSEREELWIKIDMPYGILLLNKGNTFVFRSSLKMSKDIINDLIKKNNFNILEYNEKDDRCYISIEHLKENLYFYIKDLKNNNVAIKLKGNENLYKKISKEIINSFLAEGGKGYSSIYDISLIANQNMDKIFQIARKKLLEKKYNEKILNKKNACSFYNDQITIELFFESIDNHQTKISSKIRKKTYLSDGSESVKIMVDEDQQEKFLRTLFDGSGVINERHPAQTAGNTTLGD